MIKKRVFIIGCLLMFGTIHTLQAQAHPRLLREVLSDIVKSIPSPLEVSFLIEDLRVPYNNNYINDPTKAKSYKTSIKQALNLGVYSTDVGYTQLYKKETANALTFKANMKLAKKLKIEHLFDKKQWKEKILKGNSLDSLLLNSNIMLEKINNHFYEKKQSHLTILMLTGGWLESLYIMVNIAVKSPNELLINRIGGQKIILEQLQLLLSFYETDRQIKALILELNKLQKVYDNVKIEFTYKDPVVKQDKSEIIIVNDNTPKIILTDKVLKQILATTKGIRTKVVAKD